MSGDWYLTYRNDQKQSVSNAFQYVVLHQAAPSSSKDITATIGRCEGKVSDYFAQNEIKREKIRCLQKKF